MNRTPRVGGRLLVIDTTGRLLLIHERIEDGSTHWITPGGGVEAGEAPRSAATRESEEELGIALPAEGAEVLTTTRLWSWEGVTYEQVDHFFQARVPDGLLIAPRRLTPMERATFLGYGWWSLAELRASDQTFVPAELADVLDRLLAG